MLRFLVSAETDKRFRHNNVKMFNHISWPFSDVQPEMFLIGVWQHLNFVKKIFILNCVGLNISVPDREGTGGSCLAMVSES